MNQYTWEVAPQGRQSIKVTTFGKTHNEAMARAKAIVRDVWSPLFEADPEREIIAHLVKVEQIDSRITIGREDS